MFAEKCSLRTSTRRKYVSRKPAVTLNPSEIDAARDAKSKVGLAGIIAAFKAGEQVGKRNNKGE